MKYIEALNEVEKGNKQHSLFLGGGITGCTDWQSVMVNLLSDTELMLFNPRRANFPIDDPSAAEQQIRWEAKHLDKASAILFWFAKETIQPIVLYELGAWSMTKKQIFVGCHPDYQRKQDVEIQTAIKRPDLKIAKSLNELADQVKMWLYGNSG